MVLEYNENDWEVVRKRGICRMDEVRLCVCMPDQTVTNGRTTETTGVNDDRLNANNEDVTCKMYDDDDDDNEDNKSGDGAGLS